jgi:hypothetical protein
MRSPLSLSLSFEREGKGEFPRKSIITKGYAMTNTNNEVACRCYTCRKESNNGKGLMWNRNIGPLRDLEVKA